MRQVRRGPMITGWRGCLIVLAAVTTSGCIASIKDPERLYPLSREMELVRFQEADLIRQYTASFVTSPDQARIIRNEIIAQRMLAIDMQYTEYETALTRERQAIGFGTLTTAGGLTTGAALAASATTARILSGIASGVIAVKGHYESEVLLAQTMRTLQKQMRASRNIIAKDIATRMALGVRDYPLPAALSDVEEYYSAGTLTTGIIDLSTTAGIEEKESKVDKQNITSIPLEMRRALVLSDTTTPIPRPVVIQNVNPGGLGFFERSLKPAEIRELQRVADVCPRTGVFTTELRNRILTQLGNQKDTSSPDRITFSDFDLMRERFRAMRNQPDPCPRT